MVKQADEELGASNKEEDFASFIRDMLDSYEYLKMDSLSDGYAYKIFARNAYVGIWLAHKKSFLIARYKCGPNPYLFEEYHWDSDPRFGTVKPLELIEKCPTLTPNYDMQDKKILRYLQDLEEKNPIIDGFNSLQDRKQSAIRFAIRLRTPQNPKKKSISQMIEEGLLPEPTG